MKTLIRKGIVLPTLLMVMPLSMTLVACTTEVEKIVEVEKVVEGEKVVEKIVEIVVLPGCPWSKRALRMLNHIGIRYKVTSIDS